MLPSWQPSSVRTVIIRIFLIDMQFLRSLPGERIRFDWKIVLITIVSTLLLTVDYYFPITDHKSYDRVILYFVIPLVVIVFVFRERPGVYGFSFGDWKAGLVLTLIGVVVMTPVIWFLGRVDPSTQDYYRGISAGLPWTTFLDLIGWEFFFRGWILFGYARKFGPEALWLQAVPFAMAHLGKPPVETFSTIFGGFAFGWVAYRTRSFVWPFLIHWYIATLIIVVSAGML